MGTLVSTMTMSISHQSLRRLLAIPINFITQWLICSLQTRIPTQIIIKQRQLCCNRFVLEIFIIHFFLNFKEWQYNGNYGQPMQQQRSSAASTIHYSSQHGQQQLDHQVSHFYKLFDKSIDFSLTIQRFNSKDFIK